MIAPAVQLVVSFVMIAYFSGLAAAIVFVMILLIFWVVVRFDRVLIEQYRQLNKMENDIAESVQDAINNITTVLVLRVERLVFEAIAKKIDMPRDLYARNNRLNEIKWCITSILGQLMVAIVIVTYFLRHLGAAPGILFTSVVLLFRYLERIQDIFFQFAMRYSDIVKYRTRIGNAEELAADFRPENLTNHVLPRHWQTLEVQGLQFAYPGKSNPFNLDVSLSFKRGGRYALIGATGSGKSTFLQIMGGQLHPQSMTLLVDGVMVPERFPGICRDVTFDPQQVAVFTTTIRQNITMGADHGDDAIQIAIDMARFSEVVTGLPGGLLSSIKERGVNLSGGQQQRLALSRALLAGQDKGILLFDEPMSAVDAWNSGLILENILKGSAGKTVIMTTHDLLHLPSFDWIYLFEGGRIIAEGKFDDLRSSSPEFQKLWRRYQEHQTHDASERSAS